MRNMHDFLAFIIIGSLLALYFGVLSSILLSGPPREMVECLEYGYASYEKADKYKVFCINPATGEVALLRDLKGA